MKAVLAHSWDVSPAQARQIQLELRDRVELEDRVGKLHRIAGADAALDLQAGRVIAGVVIYRFPEMVEIERDWAEAPLNFPYIPGLLSFREMPAILAAFEKVHEPPDLIYYDGHGYAHPRRFGIACHLGVALDRPTIGCAKSRLIGEHEDPPAERGGWTPLEEREETIGAVVRTRSGVKPVYVSSGHRVGLERAVELALAVCDGYRIPRPTRDADRFVEAVKRTLRAPAP